MNAIRSTFRAFAGAHSWALEELAAARLRRRRLLFYRPMVQMGALCFDVGANVGNRVDVFLRLGARVLAVEPQRDCAMTLIEKFGQNPRFALIEEALGSSPGVARLQIPEASTIATLSAAFITATKGSGRFAEYSWDRELKVPVTTLDALIDEFGKPSFCKIDVEGYELEVLGGLSQPLPCVSFEYTSELITAALGCIDRLEALGRYRYNVSRGESMAWTLRKWVGPDDMCELLRQERFPSWGDVYAKAMDIDDDTASSPQGTWK